MPQYNEQKGIVRKCDMCSDRLAAGQAPACVNACPNQAISIALVSRDAVLEDAQADAFLPAAPSSGITSPATTWKSARAFPRNTLPANFYAVRPSREHRPLVVMLVLTQLSVGAFCVDAAVRALHDSTRLDALLPMHSLVALCMGLLALAASLLHLGRPLYAFRALLGLRSSWLSREIVAFALFAKTAMLYAAVLFRQPLCELLHCPPLPPPLLQALQSVLAGVVLGSGVLGVFCSVMVYHVTLRRLWESSRTGPLFFGTMLVSGVAASLWSTLLAMRVAAALSRELVREQAGFGLGQLPRSRLPDATTTLVCGFCSTGCGAADVRHAPARRRRQGRHGAGARRRQHAAVHGDLGSGLQGVLRLRRAAVRV